MFYADVHESKGLERIFTGIGAQTAFVASAMYHIVRMRIIRYNPPLRQNGIDLIDF